MVGTGGTISRGAERRGWREGYLRAMAQQIKHIKEAIAHVDVILTELREAEEHLGNAAREMSAFGAPGNRPVNYRLSEVSNHISALRRFKGSLEDAVRSESALASAPLGEQPILPRLP